MVQWKPFTKQTIYRCLVEAGIDHSLHFARHAHCDLDRIPDWLGYFWFAARHKWSWIRIKFNAPIWTRGWRLQVKWRLRFFTQVLTHTNDVSVHFWQIWSLLKYIYWTNSNVAQIGVKRRLINADHNHLFNELMHALQFLLISAKPVDHVLWQWLRIIVLYKIPSIHILSNKYICTILDRPQTQKTMTWLSCFGGGRRTVTVEIYFPDASKLTIEYSVSVLILINV